MKYSFASCLAALFFATAALAAPYTLTLRVPSPPTPFSAFHLGTATSPNGPSLTVNGSSLLSDGKPMLPVMGEFHYSRYAPQEWRGELLKMKAGGITIVSTYIFWIYHEETENTWDWSGARDLRKFAETCKDVGLPLIVRIGPWDHGEVRNGGFPDWLLDKKLKLRSEDPAFMAEVQKLYAQIAEQLKGLLYKDGGPVIGLQVDNEFHGKASYLLALKKLAREQGLDVPYYTRTGWPNLTSPIAFGEILPLYGAYAEGFWDRALTSMPGTYWQAFTLGTERTDTAVGTDVLGARQRTDEANAQEYPYLTCELGGGMMTSYHRRIHVDPRDGMAIEISKIGSGSNLPGFYMYHGGTNPDAHDPSITLQETQSTRLTNNNDMPAKTYDFQAPLGEFGQVRESYHLLRRTHLFLQDFAQTLAPMPAVFPEIRPTKKDDDSTLRWAVRSNGHAGFVFINNYQRSAEMPEKPNVQFAFQLADGAITFPKKPMTIPANSAMFFPFHMDLAAGASLSYATAQPVCRVTDGNVTTVVFAAIPRLSAEFAFPRGTQVSGSPVQQSPAVTDGDLVFPDVPPGSAPVFQIAAGNAVVKIMLLDDAASLQVWRGTIAGKPRIFFTAANLTLDGDTITLESQDSDKLSVTAIPSLDVAPAQEPNHVTPVAASFEQIQPAGALRTIPTKPRGNALEPTNKDFDAAAVYRIKLPASIDADRNLLLRVHYVGDVARLYLNGKLLTDNFYNGTPFDLGLRRFAPEIYSGDLQLKIIPLQKGAPIFIEKQDIPDFHDQPSVAELKSVDIVETFSVTLRPK